ncbi:MAG: ATP-binding protein [Clostridia bacterium]|jgi:AAA15 family ATPase/GTPase|nr:ATP-binding protein [Clostridia bacterium]
MLLEFTVENFLSYKGKNTLSMIATKGKDKKDIQIIEVKGIEILKNAAIYGANASGKTAIIEAAVFMKEFIINSSKQTQEGENIFYYPFKLNTESIKKPSLFEIIFELNDVVYRYGFEVNSENVVSEWLFGRYTSRESLLFLRKDDNGKVEVKIGAKFKEGNRVSEFVRKNALMLSVCAQFNGEISSSILNWFSNFNMIMTGDKNGEKISWDILENLDGKYDEEQKMLIKLIQKSDFGIKEISVRESQGPDFKKFKESLNPKQKKNLENMISGQLKALENSESYKINLKNINIKTEHAIFDSEGNHVENMTFELLEESQGTKRVFELLGPIIYTLKNNGVLFIDEIQNNIHTKLLVELIKTLMCNKADSRAQFIFTTHDVNFLNYGLFRRDQYWFVEKNKYGESELTSLVDFDEHVRKDANIYKDYLRGRYGAIPYTKLGDSYGEC